jgi:hypothetical protein
VLPLRKLPWRREKERGMEREEERYAEGSDDDTIIIIKNYII